MAEDTTNTRGQSGRFAPGRSGNPSGRPKAETTAVRERLAVDGEKVAASVIKAALAGDMQAAGLVLSRICPPLKPSAAAVSIDSAGTAPASIAAAALAAAVGGTISPDTAKTIVEAAASVAKLEEIEELRVRLEALERAVRRNKTPTR